MADQNKKFWEAFRWACW